MASREDSEGWGLLREDILQLVDDASRKLAPPQWCTASWDDLKAITDPNVMALFESWSMAGPKLRPTRRRLQRIVRQRRRSLIDLSRWRTWLRV